MLYVVNVEKSSWAQGLDERRLMLAIDFAGIVQAVGDCSRCIDAFHGL